MTKLSAAILLAGLACGIASTATARTQVDKPEEQECSYLVPVGNGNFDCYNDDTPDGKFHFMTWENNGATVVQGYPLFDGRNYLRIDQPTSYAMCQQMVDTVRNMKDFQKYDKIWCVRAGE